MDRMRTWLAVWPFVAGGVLVSHALAYRLTRTRGDAFHAYLDHAPQALVVAALVGCAVAGLATRLKAPAAWPLAVAALAAFVVQEHVERFAHTGELPWLLTSPPFLVGLLLQLPVAVLAWALARSVLAALEDVRAAGPVRSFASCVVAVPRVFEARRAIPALLAGRGPPLPYRRR